MTVAVKVSVSMQSLPVSRLASWRARTGPGQDEEIVVSLEVVGMAGEALAAVVSLGEPQRRQKRCRSPSP
jgi:hypothetical protein